MNEFIKRHKVSFSLGVIICLATLNIYLYRDSQYLSGIKNDLETANHRLNRELKKSRAQVAKFLKEISERNRTIERLDIRILNILAEKRNLETEILCLKYTARAAKKGSYANFNACIKRVDQLTRDLDMTLKSAMETEKALTFFQQKSRQQNDVITRQELVVLECRDQLDLEEHKLNRIKEAIKRLDSYYKRQFLKKNTIKYTIGMIVGLVAG